MIYMELHLGNCLEIMKNIETHSIDLLFCDLPYGQTSCKWDCLIDLELFWKQVNRICKDKTPMFFTCSTKFGVSLINSNPKNFRYDLVWVKSAPVGFLNAKKMPMKKHEMVYVFYKKLPLYDLSSHTHKFLKDNVVRESTTNEVYESPKLTYNHKKRDEPLYDPPLPTSVIKTDLYSSKDKDTKRELYRNDGGLYDPPLPTSVIRDTTNYKNNSDMYGKINRPDCMRKNNESMYDPPLPTSVIKEKKTRNTPKLEEVYKEYLKNKPNWKKINPTFGLNGNANVYDPPLPTTILEIASQKGKHATQKPTALIEWILKYYSKEDDVVLDPTMGSCSTGVACKNMNRRFIGIEMDEEIFKVAEERINC